LPSVCRELESLVIAELGATFSHTGGDRLAGTGQLSTGAGDTWEAGSEVFEKLLNIHPGLRTSLDKLQIIEAEFLGKADSFISTDLSVLFVI
jgi:hypothetical protein